MPRGIDVLGLGGAKLSDVQLAEITDNVSSAGWPYYVALLAASKAAGITVVICANNQLAERLANDLSQLLGSEMVGNFPHWETLPFERVSPPSETVGARVRVLHALRHGLLPAGYVVVTTVRSVVQRISRGPMSYGPPLQVGTDRDPSELVADLVELGYRREYQTESRGEFSVRGSIVDIFDPASDRPVRVDFFGAQIDAISYFDPETQLSLGSIDSVTVREAREVVLDEQIRKAASEVESSFSLEREALDKAARGEYFDGLESWLPWLEKDEMVLADLLGESDTVVLVEPSRLNARALDIVDEEHSLAESLARTWGIEETRELPRLHVSYDRALARCSASVVLVGGADGAGSGLASWGFSGREMQQLLERVRTLQKQRYVVVVAAESALSATTMKRSFEHEGLRVELYDGDGAQQSSREEVLRIVSGVHLSEGVIVHPLKLAVLAESDLTGRRRSHRRQRPRVNRARVDFEALAVGGYVVHDVHGVARYLGMTTRTMVGVERDYLLLEYRGSDRIYVPSDQVGLITPYNGGETPQLSRLGGADWQATKARARRAAREIAQELVVLYQKRVVTPGHRFGPDTPWQEEVEALFPFELTRDQARAIAEVKADMENPKPMDRLICGDVGFGKTEIALRAAFKAVQDGKQVAVLVPTTLLASQHFQTFSERFQGYPLRVEMLSRFLTASQSKSVLNGLANKSVDIVIGTHRLLGSEVQFSDLGLLVVDEEQRFGVTHKEAIKALRAGVDVLTLSATPIPRTLEMSLTGIRDLSLLHTPPLDRRPILTHVGAFDERAVSEAIRRELLRDGQVFYVHNRVQDIEAVRQQLEELVPEARIAVAHGQMDEGSLEQIVLDFWEQRYDVLVCTTIIESGIDMPTVNTLIVDRADRLGLGQLHQLRGRVGRSGLRAYAYLFFPPDVALSEEAFERLRTIGENTELGSGFRIAMRDLEIRGAGNLLGADQSGHMAAVGYDLYVKMVQEAVAELKGELPEPAPSEILLDLPVSASIPTSFIGREDLRLEAYRRCTLIAEVHELEAFRAELVDRFGALPEPVERLLALVDLRIRCRQLSISELSLKRSPHGSGMICRVKPVALRTSQQLRLRRLYPKALLKDGAGELVLPLRDVADPLGLALEVLNLIAAT